MEAGTAGASGFWNGAQLNNLSLQIHISKARREAQAEATHAREERDLQLAEGATSRSKMVETEAELAAVRMRLEQAVTTLDSTRHEHCELGEVHEHLKLTHAAQQVEHAEHTE